MKVTNNDIMFNVVANNSKVLAIEIYAKTGIGSEYIKTLGKKLITEMNNENNWEIDVLILKGG